MFGLEKDTFESNQKTFLACAGGMRLAFCLLCFSLLLSVALSFRDGNFDVLAQRSVISMYLSGLLTTGSLWWALSWSAARADD